MLKTFSEVKSRIRQGPIQLQLNFVIGTLILLTIISIAAVTYLRTINILHDNFRDTNMTILTETKEKINSRFRSLEKTMQLMSTDYRVQNYISSSGQVSDRDLYKYFNDCINLHKYKVNRDGITYVYDLIDDIIFLNEKRNFVSRRYNFNIDNINRLKKEQVFVKAYEKKGELKWTDLFYNQLSEDYVKTNFNGDPKLLLNQFMLIRYIVNEKYRSDIGYLAISINLDRFSGLIENINFGQQGDIFVTDYKGRILACKSKEMVLNTIDFDAESFNRVFSKLNSGYIEGKIGKETYYISYMPLDINNWRLIGLVPKKVFQAQADRIRSTVLIIGSLSFFIFLYFGSQISKGITRPLKKVILTMDKIEKSGDLSIQIEQEGPREIFHLGHSFNHMLERIAKLTKQIYEEQKMKREAELKAMQLQINPHFLYNSLDSIRWMAGSRNEDHEKVENMIDSLSTFFKIGLSGGKEKIPISDELNHVQSYLTVQKIRYNDHLNFFIDVDKEIEECITLKLILQPLVENAIYHGICKKKGTCGLIKITGSQISSDMIRFEVIDNGAGIPRDELESINRKMKNGYWTENCIMRETQGYGLFNVNSRIKISFGDKYGLHYVSTEGKGTKVEVTIPVINQ